MHIIILYLIFEEIFCLLSQPPNIIQLFLHGLASAGIQEKSSLASCSKSETILITVTFPMTRSAFIANEYSYISSVATTAGVVRENVKVLSIDEVAMQTSRKIIRLLLLAVSIHVQTSILVAIGQKTNLQDQVLLNSNLQKYGLPNGTLLIQNINSTLIGDTQLGGPVVDTMGSTAASAGSNTIGAIIGGAGGFTVLIVVTFLGLRWRKQKQAYLVFPNIPTCLHLEMFWLWFVAWL
jgi:hypothetical protein